MDDKHDLLGGLLAAVFVVILALAIVGGGMQ